MKQPQAKARLRMGETPAMMLDGIVGDELRAENIRELLESVTAQSLTVHINSPGGSVFEGLSIHNALREHPAKVRVVIDGLAASIATIIAMAGDTIAMPRNAMLMVHNPWSLSVGDADALRKDAGLLDKVAGQMLEIYRERTGKDAAELSAMMDEERWFTAAEAVEAGFADEILENDATAALARVDLSILNTLPAAPFEAVAQARITIGDEPVRKHANETAAEIRRITAAAKLPTTFADELVNAGLSLAEAQARIIDKWAEQDKAPEITNHIRVEGTYDDPAFARSAMVDALAARITGKAPKTEAARPWMGRRLADMARQCLEARGTRTSMLGDSRVIVEALHTTSDFPELLTGTGERILLDAYERAPAGVRRVAAQTTGQDFRPLQRLRIGEAPELQKVNESGEYTHGSMLETKESYVLETFGRIFGISRQALVNDDLNAFGDMAVRLGVAAAEFEAKQLVTLLTSNPTMEDSNALFHADHGNLAGSAGALSVDTLGEARRSMRRQKGIDGNTPINAEPRYLLVPAALETDAEKVLAQLAASTVDEVNPFTGRLSLVVDPRLDDDSETRWYVFAEPSQLAVLEYAYLADEPGPQMFMREGFTVDGVEWKIRLDYGSGAIDWRGGYRNDGA